MSKRMGLLALAALLLAALPVAAAPDVLDLVPEDAALGIVVRNISHLKKKGDKLFASAGLKNDPDTPDPSTMVRMLYDLFGIGKGIDEDAPAALIVPNPKSAEGEDLVFACPFKDRDQIAANFDMKGKEMEEGKIFSRPRAGFLSFGSKYCLHNKYLLLGDEEKALEAVIKADKSAVKLLSAAQRKSLADADVLICFRPDVWGDSWQQSLDEYQKQLSEKQGEAERRFAADLVAALKSVRLVLGSIRIDDGLGINVTAVFPDKVPEATRKFLASLAGDRNGSELRGLPDGPAIFAEASKGEGRLNAHLMTIVGEFFLRDTLAADWLPLPADRPNIFAALSEILKRLSGHRMAVYQNADPTKLGLLSAVAILDTADADKFLADMKQLARLAGTEGPNKGAKDDAATVEQLVRDLGDDDYEVRESASDRLRLIGEPALPLIEKAVRSQDAEVHRRAEELIRVIRETAVARRKDLLSKDTPWHLRPTFQFAAKAEAPDGRKIETARIRLTEKDKPAAAALRSVFGPDWDRVRLAVQGKQVVVLFGSDTALLDTALSNLKDGKPGLAGGKALAGFGKQADAARKLELHGSATAMRSLLRGENLPRSKAGAAPSLTSASVSVGTDRLRLDFWLPPLELAALLKKAEPECR